MSAPHLHLPQSADSTLPVELEVVSSPERLAGLAVEWDRLAADCADHTALFSSHAWIMRAWQRHAPARQRKMHVVTMRHQGELVLVAPFVRKRNLLGYDRLLWLDSMTPLYNDVVAVRDERLGPLLTELLSHLRGLRRVYTLKLVNIREDALVAPMLAAIGAPSQSRTSTSSFDLSGYPDWETWLASRSYKGRYSYRRSIRQLQEKGDLTFPVYRSGEDLHRHVAWLFHQKRNWVLEKEGKPNWLSPPGTEAFFQDIAKLEADRDQCWCATLKVDDRLVAANLLFHRGNTVFSSKMTYDPDWGRMSPGWVLNLRTIRQAIERRIKEFDLMIGKAGWKDRLKEREMPVSNYKIVGRAWRRGE